MTIPDAPTAIQPMALTVRQAAAALNLSPHYLDKLRCDGGGPRYSKLRHTGSIRYRPRDLEEWLDRFAVESTSETAFRREATH